MTVYYSVAAAQYPELAKRRAELDMARASLMRAMEAQFPYGTRVRVNHSRGSFTGTIVGAGVSQVTVLNDKTGKTSARYPLMSHGGKPDVEILEDDHA